MYIQKSLIWQDDERWTIVFFSSLSSFQFVNNCFRNFSSSCFFILFSIVSLAVHFHTKFTEKFQKTSFFWKLSTEERLFNFVFLNFVFFFIWINKILLWKLVGYIHPVFFLFLFFVMFLKNKSKKAQKLYKKITNNKKLLTIVNSSNRKKQKMTWKMADFKGLEKMLSIRALIKTLNSQESKRSFQKSTQSLEGVVKTVKMALSEFIFIISTA